MKVWRIGSKWGDTNIDILPIFKEYKIAFVGGKEEEEVQDIILKIQSKDMIAITKGQAIVGLASVKKLKLLADINLSLVEIYGDLQAIELSDLFLGNFGTYGGQGRKFHQARGEYAKLIKIEFQKMQNPQKMEKLKTLLLETRNLIFTGAPGTGKTYLAKQIAAKIIGTDVKALANNEQFAFVQFHPSYDYTDFVEGLRPTRPDENGNIGFELKSGIFKVFCEKAKQATIAKNADNFEELYNNFINDLSENSIELVTPKAEKKFTLTINSAKTCVATPQTDTATRLSISKEVIKEYVLSNRVIDWKPYTVPIGEYFKANYKLETPTSKTPAINKNFVIVIDEINRGEISKIFGELFFSIDPSYRGVKGSVKTQFSNLQEKKGNFYVPENVYIIGTMNDIDRSVESFDFAMRRRFTWLEITAQESAENMNLPEEVKTKMNNLNSAIDTIDGLNSSYHIGGAYFLDKNGEPNKDFDNIWKYRLAPLLSEYLRGTPDAQENMKKLKAAYDKQQ